MTGKEKSMVTVMGSMLPAKVHVYPESQCVTLFGKKVVVDIISAKSSKHCPHERGGCTETLEGKSPPKTATRVTQL